MKILEGHLSEVNENESLSGEVAFQLHDTYGFPMELTQEIAAERKIAINLEQFNDAMALQRERGKQIYRRKVIQLFQIPYFKRLWNNYLLRLSKVILSMKRPQRFCI